MDQSSSPSSLAAWWVLLLLTRMFLPPLTCGTISRFQ